MKPRVLLVEENAERLEGMTRALSPAFECHAALTVEEAVGQLPDGQWAAVVVSYHLAGVGSGAEVVQIVRETSPCTFRVLCVPNLTPQGRHDIQRMLCPHFTANASESDYVETVRRALESFLGPAPAESTTEPESGTADAWTAHAPVTREFLAQLRDAAEQDVPVYVYGESGAGRMCAAQTLCRWRRQWKASGRPDRANASALVPTLRVPSLRERRQDLPAIAARCLATHKGRSGTPRHRLSPAALGELFAREWPRNILELSALLGRAVQRVGDREVIESDDLPRSAGSRLRPSQRAKDEGQRDCLLRQLRAARTVSAAARLEGCTRVNYIRLMRRLGILRADAVGEG